jgi:hypothetical protein
LRIPIEEFSEEFRGARSVAAPNFEMNNGTTHGCSFYVSSGILQQFKPPASSFVL